MTVSLTISEVFPLGAQVSDALAGGGTGVDLGSVVNNQYAPVTDKSANTGAQDLYIRHDAAVDPITDVKTFIQQFGTGTGFSYGGANSAAADFTSLKNLGDAAVISSGMKNNGDSTSGGLWLDMDADVAVASQFDYFTNGISSAVSQGGNDTVRIYGDNGPLDGIDLASAFVIKGAAMVYDAAGETVGSSPVDGQIGLQSPQDTTLGTHAHMKLRIYLPDSHIEGGILQWEWVVAYSFTA